MRKLLTLVLLLWWALPGYVQVVDQAELDSLLKSPNDTTKVLHLLELVRTYISDTIELSEQLADEAIRAAEAIDYEFGMIKGHRAKGYIISYKGGVEDAIDWYDKALVICADNPKFKLEKISVILNKGVVYFYGGDDGKALEQYIEAEALCDDPSTHEMLGKVLNNMAIVYRQLERIEDAIRIYKKSVELKTKNKDTLGMATTMNNIGLSYGYLKNYEESLRYLDRAQSLFEAIGQIDQARSVDFALATSLYKMGDVKNAKVLLAQTLALQDLKLPFYELMQNELLLAKIYVEEKEFENASRMLNIVFPKIKGSAMYEALQTYYKLSASTKFHENRLKEAYQDLLQHKLITDTIVESQRLELEKEMETKYLTKEKETQIAIQQLEIAKNKREKLLFILALAGLSIILLLGFFLYRQRQKANKLLSSKNAIIQKALNEKEILLKEIHHRVKNNLQVISSLLSLQSRQIDDPKALEAIREGRNRVNSMALIHKNLYQEDNLVGVDAADYIEKLTTSLMANYQISEQEILIEKDIDRLQLDVDVVIPLGLILNELITNCLKYAFEENQAGKIEMSLKREESGLRLKVADNGRGLPSDFNLEELTSMGFRLIKAFALKLEAALNISSVGGTQVELLIPHLQNHPKG